MRSIGRPHRVVVVVVVVVAVVPPVVGADLRAAFVASCLRGALPPVDLRAVCFVRAMACDGMRWMGDGRGESWHL